MSYVPLTPLDILLAAALLIANGAISWGFRLGLEKSIAIAAARMVVQLALIGVVLKFIFAQTSPAWTVAFALVMVVAAGVEVVSRQHRSFDGWRTMGLSTATLLFIGTVVTVFGVGVIITPDPWYAPRYVLPILGMVLGNSMTAVALVLDGLGEAASRERSAIEARLALGAPRFEALGGAAAYRAAHRYDADAQRHGDDRPRRAARHDDGPDHCRCRSGRRRKVSDADHVSHRRRYRPRLVPRCRRRRGAAHRRATPAATRANLNRKRKRPRLRRALTSQLVRVAASRSLGVGGFGS